MRTARRGKHCHRETSSSTQARQQCWKRRRSEEARTEHENREEKTIREQPQYCSGDEGHAFRLIDRRSRCFEQMAVRHSRWTSRLASAAAQATADVRLNRFVVRRDGPFEKRPHEKDSAARTVVLILQCEIGWARLKTESAVHTRVDSRELACEWRIGKRAGR